MADLITIDNSGKAKTGLKCTGCELHKEARLQTNCMGAEGPEPAELLVVGHAPGYEDDGVGRPYTGMGGRDVRNFLRKASIRPEDCKLTNTLLCCPYDTDTKQKHFDACKKHLKKTIEKTQPEGIIAFGAKAFQWLTGFSRISKFRRIGIPCLLNPDILVYGVNQPMMVRRVEREDKQKVEAEIVKDLIFIRKKLEAGELNVSDETEVDYKTARSVQDVKDFFAEFEEGDEVAWDLETADKNWSPTTLPFQEGARIVLLAVSKGPGHGRAIPVHARGVVSLEWWSDEELEEVKSLCADFLVKHKLFGHNAIQFDQKWVWEYFGITQRLHVTTDTMLAHYLYDPEKGGHKLQDLAVQYGKMRPWKPPNLKKLMHDTENLALYGAKDVDATWRTKVGIDGLLTDKQQWLMDQLMLPLGYEYAELEFRGLPIDRDQVHVLGQHLDRLLDKYKKELKTLEPVKKYQTRNSKTFNPAASGQVAEIMEDILELPCIKRTDTGAYSTAVDVLEEYLHEDFVRLVYYTRKLDKLKSNYYKPFLEKTEERPALYTSVKLHGTVTGRPSSEAPNLFVFPRSDTLEKAGLDDPTVLKACISTKQEGNRSLLQVDLSQAELRVLAMYSKDPLLVDYYRRGVDVHTATAAALFNVSPEEVTKGQRSSAKIINFSIIYGKSEMGLIKDFISAARSKERDLAKEEGREPVFGPDEEQEAADNAVKVLKAHQKAHPRVWAWLERTVAQARRYGYQETFFGRRRYYPRWSKSQERQAKNFPIQCLHPDTMVLTNHGYRRLEEFQEDDLVYDGEEWARARLHGPRKKKMWEVELNNGLTTKCSGDHLFATEFGWVPVRELQVGNTLQSFVAGDERARGVSLSELVTDEVVEDCNTRRGPGPKQKTLSKPSNTINLAWFLGLMVGDGTYTKHNSVAVVVSYQEKAIMARLRAFLGDIKLDYREKVIFYRSRPSYISVSLGTCVFRLMEAIGFNLANVDSKDIPQKVMNLPFEERAAFVQGLFDADSGITGSAKSSFNLVLNVVTRRLAENTVRILGSLGISAFKMVYTTKKRDVHRVTIHKDSLGAFHTVVGYTELRKHRLLEMVLANRDLQAPGPKKEGLRDVSVLRVTETENEVEMWDLEVASERHAFVVDNVLVHNSLAADISLFGLVRSNHLIRLEKYDANLILTVYDSLIYDVANEHLWDVAELVKFVYENMDFDFFNVPLVADAEGGPNWGELKEMDVEKREFVCK